MKFLQHVHKAKKAFANVFNVLKYHSKPKQMLWWQPQAKEGLGLYSLRHNSPPFPSCFLKIHNSKCYDLHVNNPVVARRELHCELNVKVFCRPQHHLVLFMDEEQAKKTITEYFT